MVREVQCTPPEKKISVTIEDDVGVVLSCETTENFSGDGPDYEITAPNKCILICDFHLGLTIESRLKEDTGEWGFFIVETGAEIIDPLTQVKCWPSE